MSRAAHQDTASLIPVQSAVYPDVAKGEREETRCSLQVFMWVTRTKHNSLHSQCAAVPGKSLMVSLRAVLKAGSTSTRSELVTALLGRQREPQEAFKDGEFVSW